MKNILNKFTIRNLKLNMKRTIATCIGIILSTALICAVAGMFSSFQQTLLERAKKSDGDYHTIFYDVPKEKQKFIINNREVESSFVTQGVGYAKLDGSKNEYKPYLYLMEFDETAMKQYGIKLVEGKLPENDNEILISQHIEENGGVKYKIGDKIKLNIGQRMTVDGYELNQDNPYNNPKDKNDSEYVEEELESIETKEFTVVGIMERPNRSLESYDAPGYTVISKLTHIRNDANILVKYKNIKNTYKTSEQIDKLIGTEIKYEANSELLRWSGVTKSDDTMKMFYSLAGIIIGIIIVTSIFVIRNSFAISITEKMKQYGMLSSIGATKKQIKKNILFEGMILGVISIPIGILCGILATFILIQISTLLVGNTVFTENVKFIFNVPISAIIISVVLGFLTIYLSCIFSARKASKISPITAIRSNEDIKIKSNKIKSPKIINKIFGIGGEIAYKNLKRNKKKYRTTVISLVVSITVFISLNSFMNYVFGVTDVYYKNMEYNVGVYITPKASSNFSYNDTYEYFKNIAKNYNLEDYSIIRSAYVSSESLKDKMTDEYKEFAKRYEEYDDFTIISLGEKEYEKYTKEIGIKYQDAKDGIIYYDSSSIYNYDTYEKIKSVNINVGDEINCSITPKQSKQKSNFSLNLKIVKIADKSPMNETIYSTYGTFIISDEVMDKINDNYCFSMKINAKNPEELCKKLDEESKGSFIEENNLKFDYTNFQEERERDNKIVLLISIFLYGFIVVITLIGVTNIFNTITTNMNLRSKEFAMLKSIGMTKKEFNKMINLESIFYGIKSLIIGITLGLGLSYWIYTIVKDNGATERIKFIFPTYSIIISIVFIMVIVGIIMKYSLNKINKQNIIETIRNDNI